MKSRILASAACFAGLSSLLHAQPINVGDPLEVPIAFRAAAQLTFQTAVGKYYQIQISPDLANWDNEGYAFKGTGGQMTVLASTRNYTNRVFYLLRDNGDPNNLAPTGGGIGGLYRHLRVTRPSPSTVTITADRLNVESDSGAVAALSSVNVTAGISVSGTNGLDTGSAAGSTWYYVWIISNGRTTAALLSTSATSPQLPSGYTHKALVSYARTDGSGQVLNFTHVDHNYRWGARMPVVSGDVPPTWTTVNLLGMVPPNKERVVNLAVDTGGFDNSNIEVRIRTKGSNDDGVDTATGCAVSGGGVPTYVRIAGDVMVMTDSNSQIEYRCSNGSGRADIRVKGFAD